MAEPPAFFLKTLGAVSLQGPHPAIARRLVNQPKQLALLAFLAARRRGERVGRDRIMATFWPDSSAARARGSLRTTLHRLRASLGADPFESHGDSLVIRSDLLGCDAAILLGDDEGLPPEDMLGLYGGEFLDVLHVKAAPDFEHWVDRTRAAVRARVTEIAWTLSGRAEAAGQWISAARYARRAAELAVDVEQATQRLIGLLDRAGDRAAAVAEYDRLARLLEREFGLSPSPETTALLEQVRERDRIGEHPVEIRPIEEERPRSIAVLPFEDLSDGAGDYLAAGLSDEILSALSRIRDVRVISRDSVRRSVTHTPRSMRQVHEQLGVDLVVEGSVQILRPRCRVSVRLVDVRHDASLWARTYDRDLSNMFEVQSDVALQITRALRVQLSPREHRRLRRPPTPSFRAWQLYLKGRELWSRRVADALRRAASLFESALELDPELASAWVGLADTRLSYAALASDDPAADIRAAKAAVRRALECDPESGEAHATLGLILTFIEPDPEAAEAEYRRAVEHSPGHATAHQWYGNWLCAYGRGERGLVELDIAVDLDPLSPVVSDSMALALMHLGRWQQAESQFRHTLELDPGFWRSRVGLAVCCAHRGDRHGAASEFASVWSAGAWGTDPHDARIARRLLETDASAALHHLLDRARANPTRGTIRPTEILLLLMLDRPQDAVDLLQAGCDEGWLGFVILYAPMLDSLASEPRFRGVMRQAGFLLPRWGTS